MSGALEILLDDQPKEEPESLEDPSQREEEVRKSVRKFLQAPDVEALLDKRADVVDAMELMAP